MLCTWPKTKTCLSLKCKLEIKNILTLNVRIKGHEVNCPLQHIGCRFSSSYDDFTHGENQVFLEKVDDGSFLPQSISSK